MPPKINILYAVTKSNWGGAQKYVFELATHLPRSKYNITVAYGEGEMLAKKLEEASISTRHINRLGRDVNLIKDSWVFFDLTKLFRKERPDIVHLNSSKIGGLGALAARLTGIKKIIFTVHGFAFKENRPWIQKKIIAFLSWLTVVLSTDIIFISRAEYNQAIAWPLVKKKAHLIFNGIDSPQFTETSLARAKLAQIIGKPTHFFDKKTVIGTIAELTGNKGLVYAIEALKNSSNFIYIIIGKGELENELQRSISTAHLEEKIFLAGFVQDASCLLRAFDIFLLPSLKEGMPYVLLEAGFAENAVISTTVGGIPEIITDQQSGLLIPPADPQAIQTALATLADNPSVRIRYGKELQKKVEKTFTLAIMVEKTLALYSRGTI